MSLKIKGFVFGEYLLQKEENVLLRSGKPLSITPKALQLLLVLVENHGRLIEKNDLMKKVWSDSFVEEVNLSFTISVLRKTLEDDKQNPRFIETIPRRGYRFIAEVKEIINEEPQTIPQPPPEISFNLKKFLIPASAVLIIALTAGAFWLIKGGNYSSAAKILTTPFSSEKFSSSGKVKHAAISPDGKFAAFVDKTGEKYSVWLRKLETSENVQIVQSTDEVYFGISFSHDGQTVFFVRGRGEQESHSGIYRVSAFGGIPEKIIDHTEGWMSLSPDDKQISFVRCNAQNDDYCSLMLADADGKNERKLITRPHPIRISDNQFSPDGKSIAFADGNSENGGSDFRLLKLDLSSGAESEISKQKFFDIKNLKWLPDGQNLLLAALDNLDGKAKIWQVSAESGKAEPLTNDAANYQELSLDKDAAKMIAVQFSNNFQMYFFDGSTTKSLTVAREAIFDSDGRIIFSADDNDIWTIAQNGGEQRQLTNNQFKDFHPIPSSDGKFIYFTSNRSGTSQIWRMNSDGSNQIQITKNEGGYPYFVTSDDKWVYYQSGLQENLWKVSTENNQESIVLNQKMLYPAFSPDGNFFAFFFRDREKDNQVKIRITRISDLKEVKTLEFAEARSVPVRIDWLPDNKTLYYITYFDSKNSLWKQSLEEEKPHFITDLGDKEIEYFSLAKDGNSYAYTRGEWLHNAVLLKGLK